MKDTLWRLVRIFRRREVLALTLNVMLAELVVGTYNPYFALFAKSLGASVAMVGALVAAQTLSRTVNCLTIGTLSDRIGRKVIIIAGMALLAVAIAGMTWLPSPNAMFITQIMIGAAHAGVFDIGIGYLGDVVPREDRGAAIGLFTTVMGLGFGLGSSLGGALVGAHGNFLLAFRATALIALVGVAISSWGLRRTLRPAQQGGGDLPPGWRLRAAIVPMLGALRNRVLLSGAILNVLKMAWFAVVGGGFMSLYMASHQISAETIGLIFGLRAITSSSARLPAGLLTKRLSSYWIIIAATCLTMIGFFLLPLLQTLTALAIFIAIEGAMFGALISVGNAFVAENARPEHLGSALGLFGTVGGAGSTALALLVGLIAQWRGMATMFVFMGLVLALGMGLSLYVRRLGQHQDAVAPAD
jgi:MFS family permease